MNVLVVEVDKTAIHALKALLKLGHAVLVSKNGKDGLTVLGQKPFDLLMVDVESPELGGTKAVSALRQKEKESGKRLAVVGLGTLPERRDGPGLRAEFDHFLPKPLRQQQLLDLMEKLAPARPVADAVSNRPPVNREAGLALCDGDEELFLEILGVFRVDAHNHVEKLKKALESADANLTQRHAHALKGASSNICAEPFKEAAMEIERAARNDDMDGARRLYAKLINEYVRLIAYLASVLPREETSF